MMLRVLAPLLIALTLPAQSVDALIERLDRLERDNNTLRQEIERLRAELGGLKRQAAAQSETQEITARRLEEQAQTKVEAAQKFPIRLRGMALVNFFHNGSRANGADTPTTAARAPGRATSAVTFRQTVLGLDFRGPRTILGAEVSGSVFGDFYEGGTEATQYPSPRLRTAEVVFEWKTRSLMFGQEKTLVGLRDPNSLAYSGVSPMTAAGNLWRWQPQIRFEQRLAFTAATQALAQVAVVQTAEESGGTPGALSLERRRPALQGRVELAHTLDASRRFEVAGAFHASTSHVGPYSIPSRVYSLDWFANPFRYLEFSGILYAGQNLHHFGAFRQGWAVTPAGVHAIHTRGGWAQLSVPFHSRVSLNLIAGAMDDRNRDLTAAMIASNRNAAANLVFRIAPNVLVALEAMRIRTLYLNGGLSRNPRYDLSIAYQF